MVGVAEELKDVLEEEGRFDEALHRRFWTWKDRRPHFSQRAVASMLRVSEASLSEYKHRRYKGDLVALEAKIEGLLDREEALAPTFGPSYVETEVALEVMDFLATCHDKGFMGVLHGPAGCGKTCSVIMYRLRRPEILLLTASPRWRSPDNLLQALGQALRTYADEELIIRQLKHSRALVVIDESQLLRFEIIEQARYIYDKSGSGIVLCGTPDLVGNLKRRHHEQLERRAFYRKAGYETSPGDVEAVAKSICPELNEEALAFLRRQGAAVGRLGRVQKFLTAAVLLNDGGKIGLATLKKAAGWVSAETETGGF